MAGDGLCRPHVRRMAVAKATAFEQVRIVCGWWHGASSNRHNPLQNVQRRETVVGVLTGVVAPVADELPNGLPLEIL